jgi:hypothetical protein
LVLTKAPNLRENTFPMEEWLEDVTQGGEELLNGTDELAVGGKSDMAITVEEAIDLKTRAATSSCNLVRPCARRTLPGVAWCVFLLRS